MRGRRAGANTQRKKAATITLDFPNVTFGGEKVLSYLLRPERVRDATTVVRPTFGEQRSTPRSAGSTQPSVEPRCCSLNNPQRVRMGAMEEGWWSSAHSSRASHC